MSASQPLSPAPCIGLASPEETTQLARWLGRRLAAGDALLLEGPIGAGKSHFCRAVIQSRLAAIGRCEDVPSPTFTLVQVYDLGNVEIWHADLYRLTAPEEVWELGLDEAFDEAICLVEWPDRLGPARPADALTLTFAPGPADPARILRIMATSPRWSGVIAALAAGAWRADD
ncbi:MAG: tRNA (adenosine(37)-N6)-threonylcarbamoyltransferase complex ATPase subunit type 1 TsaE [Albidovulum sp.]